MFIKKRLKMPKERLRKEEIKEGRAEEGNNEAGREGWKEKQVLSLEFVCVLLRLWSVILALVLFILTPETLTSPWLTSRLF